MASLPQIAWSEIILGYPSIGLWIQSQGRYPCE
jgi:hypothetical protein